MTTPIAALAARLALSAEGNILRQLTLNRSIIAAKAIWPKATVTPVGSFAQGTSLSESDIDLVVHMPDLTYRPDSAARWASKLKWGLIDRKTTLDSTSEVLGNARVPILTYTDLETEVGVDVSFLPNSIANTEYVKGELERRPYIRTLVVLLKYWLKSRNMNKVFTGGLGSYALSLTVIGYFNVRKHTKARKVTQETYEQWLAEENIYHLLIDYLAFWGAQWKYASTMLEPGEGGIYKKGSKGHVGGKRNSCLAIGDPTDPTNDVGSKALKVSKLKTAMMLLRDKLEAAGPDITESDLLDLLTNTGRMFRAAASWNHNSKAKGRGKRAASTRKSKKRKAKVPSTKKPKEPKSDKAQSQPHVQ